MLPFPMFPPRPVGLALARQHIALASLSPTASLSFALPALLSANASPPHRAALSRSRKRAKREQVTHLFFGRYKGPFLQLLSIHLLANLRGAHFFPPLFLRQSSPIPHFGPTLISATISRPWPLWAFQCPVDAAQELVSR
jgi:hypothetical protein